jgi:hypothetical protein
MSDMETTGVSQTSAPEQQTAAPVVEHETTTETLEAPQGEQSAAPVDENAELLSLLPADDGMEEIEHEGIKAKVPKEMKDAFLRQQDYTRKTQEVAEQRRQIEAQAAEIQRQSAFQQQNIAEVARIVSLDSQLAEYSKIDWNTLIAQNPQQAFALDRQMRELQGQKAQLAQSLTQKQQQQALVEQQATAKRIQEGQRELEREIKGWSPELATKLTEHGRKLGFPAEVLNGVTQPAFVKTLHKAYLYDQLIAQRATKAPAAPAQPVTRVGARASTAVTDPDKLDADAWMKWRTAQLDAKRKKR